MFKSIQWKLVLLYLLLVIFLITIIGVLLLRQVENLYYDNFEKGIKTSMSATGFSNINIDVDNLDALKSRVNSYSGMFLIDGIVRNIYILDNFGTVKYGSYLPPQDIDKKQITTSNIMKAMLGQVGDVINLKGDLDYAQPVITKDANKYVVYITDNKADLVNSLNRIKKAILASAALALLLSTIIGFLFARTITVPIKNLAQKARLIADGDFEQRIEAKSEDEIGELTKDFNHMAAELKETLNEIGNEKSKVEAILMHMTDGVMAFDINGNIIHINPAAQNILKSDFSDKSFDEVFLKLDADVTLGEFIYLDDSLVKERKIELGKTFIKLYFVSFKSESGETGGIIVVLQDITDQQKLDNMRREFVANVSHELRTPLTTIKSYVETLLDGALDDRETSNQFLEVIETETDRMTRLVKDLLQLSKMDYQQAEWKSEHVSLDNLIRELVKKISIEAKNKNQTLEYFMTSSVPDVTADRDKIEQVLLNIISNSIKYTQEGGTISVYLGQVHSEAYVKVVDNGMGIPKKDLPRIFERFYRVDKARTREFGGTGLGLSIAKEIIEAHGGSIAIDSEIGKGTEVVINLPVAQTPISSLYES